MTVQKPNRLTQIARQLRTHALRLAEASPEGLGLAQYTLRRGLTLTLVKRRDAWQLSLTRWGRPADVCEAALCRRAFRTPDEAQEESASEDGWEIIRLNWRDAPPVQLSFLPAAESPAAYYRQK